MGQTDLLAAERQAAILDRIRTNGRVLASELASEFQTSEDTIRRALRDLAEQGLCKRVYGGALAVTSAAHPIAVRSEEAIARKAALGAALGKIVARDQFVYIDGGTTNLAAARVLVPDFGLTVATQDPAIATVLATREDTTLIMIGGQVKPHIGCAVGVEAMRQMMDLRPDLLLLGVCSLDSDKGAWAVGSAEAASKKCLHKTAPQTATAALNDKLSAPASFFVCANKAIHTLVV